MFFLVSIAYDYNSNCDDINNNGNDSNGDGGTDKDDQTCTIGNGSLQKIRVSISIFNDALLP